jgi:hypothetical protein
MIAALNSTTQVDLRRMLISFFSISVAESGRSDTIAHLSRYGQTVMRGIAALPSNAVLCRCP